MTSVKLGFRVNLETPHEDVNGKVETLNICSSEVGKQVRHKLPFNLTVSPSLRLRTRRAFFCKGVSLPFYLLYETERGNCECKRKRGERNGKKERHIITHIFNDVSSMPSRSPRARHTLEQFAVEIPQ